MRISARYYLWAHAVYGAILLAWVVSVLRAAQQREMASPERVAELTIRPVSDMHGALVAVIVTAKINCITAHPSGLIDSHEVGTVTFDLCKADNGLAHAVYASGLKAWHEAHPKQLPSNSDLEQRRATRSK